LVSAFMSGLRPLQHLFIRGLNRRPVAVAAILWYCISFGDADSRQSCFWSTSCACVVDCMARGRSAGQLNWSSIAQSVETFPEGLWLYVMVGCDLSLFTFSDRSWMTNDEWRMTNSKDFRTVVMSSYWANMEDG
jgi:hypothetical protein